MTSWERSELADKQWSTTLRAFLDFLFLKCQEDGKQFNFMHVAIAAQMEPDGRITGTLQVRTHLEPEQWVAVKAVRSSPPDES
jgi:hypothetical protein